MELRPFQKQALEHLFRPGHLICVAPTGSGKSLIYERAAADSHHRTLLITPLVALGRQQQTRIDADPHLRARFRILSPEKLLFEPTQRALQDWRPNFLVVDECHCLWEWGERFRPAFQKIPELIHKYSIPRSVWLTATLPLEAREDLRTRLPQPITEFGSFDLPPNLDLRVIRLGLRDRAQILAGWVRQQKSPGIVFVPTREDTHRISRLLIGAGVRATPYHAGMGSEERKLIEAALNAQSAQIIVATSAFGMGMNYPQLDWVVLWQAPPNLLAFAQAIGRVGRNPQKPCRALAFWDPDDFRRLEWAAHSSIRRQKQLLQVSAFLQSKKCRRLALRSYFEDTAVFSESTEKVGCGLCDICAPF